MTTHPLDGEVSILDDLPENAGSLRFAQNSEIGATGLKRSTGTIDEEFLPALRGRKAIEVFREMSKNDAIIGALLFAIDKLVREVKWEVHPADNTPEGQQAQEFVEQCRDDMSHSFDDMLSEILSMLPYGFSYHEIVYKKRVGPWEKNGSKRSKYDDGMIGWRKMPIRSQETLLRWLFDETGGLRGFVQLAPPLYKTVVIPIEKSLLFRTTLSKGNPEGLSILRNSYRSWWMKKRIEEFEAIGVERDLAGMPTLKIPSEYLKAPNGTDKWKAMQAYRKMVRGVRRDENEGLILPSDMDVDTKTPLFEFELMNSGGTRQFDTNAIITRYEQRILMTVLADFILVGHEDGGSYSLHTDKTGIFRASLNSITQSIADTLNRYAIPRLFLANGWKPRELPKFVPTEIDPPDLQQLAEFISSTAGAGMQWFPDPDLEKFIRDAARLPEMTDETLEFKRAQAQQGQAMEYASGQMEMLGAQQKAEMTAAGYSPEQAQGQAEQPRPDQQQDIASSEMDGEEARANHPFAEKQKQEEQATTDRQFALEEASKDKDRAIQQQDKGEERKFQQKDKSDDRTHQMKLERMKAAASKQNNLTTKSKKPNTVKKKP